MGEIIQMKKDNKTIDRNKLIDSLFAIRLPLTIKKLSSNVILKSEFKQIVDSVKEDAKDEQVSNAIDDLFKEYFQGDKNKENNNSLSIDEMEKFIDKNAVREEIKTSDGKSYVKIDLLHNKNKDKQDAA